MINKDKVGNFINQLKVNRVYYLSNIIFYLCMISMIIMDYTNYNDYIWGISTLAMIISFIVSLGPDLLINLNYKISEKFVKHSIISKLICLILFLGIWSYLNYSYKFIALCVYIIIFLYDIYLFNKIKREIFDADIQLKEVIKRIKELDFKNKEQIYNLLYKSLIGLILYITFPKEDLILSIISSVLIFIFELIMIKKIRLEAIKMYPENMKKINSLSIIMIINIIIIILSVSNIKIFFSCLFIGLNWVIVSDNIIIKKTSFKNFR